MRSAVRTVKARSLLHKLFDSDLATVCRLEYRRQFGNRGLRRFVLRAGAATLCGSGFFRLIEGDVTIPMVGAANATAVAGGFELLLACDVIVASSDAEFGLPEVKRGLFPAGGGTFIGTRIPLGIALELTMTGDRIDAARAY